MQSREDSLSRKLKLSDEQRKVLSLVELDAELTAPDIAKKLRLKTPTVQRLLQGFREDGLFAGKTAVVDTARIGLIEFGIGVVLGSLPSTTLESFFQYAQKKRALSWVAEVGGGFDLSMNILARNPQTALNILLEIEKRFPALIQEKSVCIRTRRFRFWRGYLHGRVSKAPRFIIGASPDQLAMSEDDSRVLFALSQTRFETYRDVARSLGMPIASFLRRVRSLRERKILLGFGYRMNLDEIGVQQFRVLVFTNHCSPETEQSLLGFCGECPWVKVLTTCLGPWSFELEIDVMNQAGARDVASGIRSILGESVKKVLLLPIFAHRKYISFPPPE